MRGNPAPSSKAQITLLREVTTEPRTTETELIKKNIKETSRRRVGTDNNSRNSLCKLRNPLHIFTLLYLFIVFILFIHQLFTLFVKGKVGESGSPITEAKCKISRSTLKKYRILRFTKVNGGFSSLSPKKYGIANHVSGNTPYHPL